VYKNIKTIQDQATKPMVSKDGFILPLGLIPSLDDVDDVKEIVLRNGYIKQPIPLNSEKYKGKYHIALSADRMDGFIKKFAEQILPDKAYAILEVISYDNKNKTDSKIEYLTPFIDKNIIVNRIDKYMFRIINDADVAFGLAFYTSAVHDEIFLTNKKRIIVYTSNPTKFENILSEEDIQEFEDYDARNFIENYPNANMNLFALAMLYPDRYGQYKKFDEYFTLKYTQQLIKELQFKEN
jgi:hypothetical protein